MCKKVQTPVLKIGTTVHVGGWAGTVESIERDKAIVFLDNGKRFPVSFDVIEEAIEG